MQSTAIYAYLCRFGGVNELRVTKNFEESLPCIYMYTWLCLIHKYENKKKHVFNIHVYIYIYTYIYVCIWTWFTWKANVGKLSAIHMYFFILPGKFMVTVISRRDLSWSSISSISAGAFRGLTSLLYLLVPTPLPYNQNTLQHFKLHATAPPHTAVVHSHIHAIQFARQRITICAG